MLTLTVTVIQAMLERCAGRLSSQSELGWVFFVNFYQALEISYALV